MSRRPRDPFAGGRETFEIAGPEGSEESRYAAPLLALVQAQARAEREGRPVVLTVSRRALVGGRPPTPIYRVERDADGVVLTTILSKED